MSSCTPSLRVVIIRHGQSVNNVLLESSYSSFAGGRVPDAALTTAGLAQAAATGEALARAQLSLPTPISLLYCSAMDRALHTAAIVGDRLGLQPLVWPALHEVGGSFANTLDEKGRLIGYEGVPGMGTLAIAQRYPTALIPPASSGLTEAGWWASPGRETEGDAIRRVASVLEDLRARARALGRHASAAAAGQQVEGGERGSVDICLPRGSSPSAVASCMRSVAVSAQAAAAWQPPSVPAHALRIVATGVDAAGTEQGAGASASPLSAACSPSAGHLCSETVALVSHGDTIDVLLRLLGGSLAGEGGALGDIHAAAAAAAASAEGAAAADPMAIAAAAAGHTSSPLRFVAHNCSLLWLEVMPSGNVRVLRSNDCAHLQAAHGPAALGLQEEGAELRRQAYLAEAQRVFGHTQAGVFAPRSNESAGKGWALPEGASLMTVTTA